MNDASHQTTSPKRYVAGFLFTPDLSEVVLIEKLRPAWQKDLLNGVGGKIEPGEVAAVAMRREFREEAGVDVEEWRHFAMLEGDGFQVEFFRAANEAAFEVESHTDERIVRVPVERVLQAEVPTISNLRWLVPMALPTSSHDWPYAVREHARPHSDDIRCTTPVLKGE